MGKHEKLIERILEKPKNFTYDELKRLLNGLGYSEEQRGRTSGSAVAFYNEKTKDKINIHKPHPAKEVKLYVIDNVIDKLKLKKKEVDKK